MMANSNVPATPSQEELREKENIKNVKNSEERESDNLNSNIDNSDSLPTASTSQAVDREAGSLVTKPSKVTKIPGPIALGPSASTFQMSNRKYTSVLDLTKGRQQSANDSGIQLDTSMSDVEVTVPSDLPSPVPSYRSEMELQLAEQQTLKELQRVVAEMEAQVAMDDEEEQGEAEPEGLQNENQQKQLANEPGQGSAPDIVQINEEKSGSNENQPAAAKAQQEPLAHEVEPESTQKQASDEAQINEDKSGQKEDPPAVSEAQQEPLATESGQDSAQNAISEVVNINKENLGLTDDQPVASKAPEEPLANGPGQKLAQKPASNEEKSEQKEDPLAGQGSTNNEVLQDNQQLGKKKSQKEIPEPVKELSPDSEHKFPQIVVQEPSVGSVEVQIQQAFENINQFQAQVPLEGPVDALDGGSESEYERFLREQFEKPAAPNQDLPGEPQPEEVADADLSTTSEAVLIAPPSQTGSVGADRRMVRLEELLGNANNVDLLRRLLQIGAEGNIIDSEPDIGTQESSGEDKDTEPETESGPGTSTPTGTATGTDASTDDDVDEDEDEEDASSEGLDKVTFSLMRRLFSGKLVTLAGPIIFCGLAAGLIYLSRKA